MKQNKKGFTLIELLAVIVILAIIALIATPIILNMISKARRSAAKSSALGYVDSVEYYANFKDAASDLELTSEYTATVPTGQTCTYNDARAKAETVCDASNTAATKACDCFFSQVNTKSKGKAPNDGSTVTIDSNGKVSSATLTYAGGTCNYNGQDCEMTN